MQPKPSARVRAAMEHISRNRFIPPDEVARIGMHLASCASHGQKHIVYKAAVPDFCNFVGMINGQPPFFMRSKEAKIWMKKVKRLPKNTNFEIELLKTQWGCNR